MGILDTVLSWFPSPVLQPVPLPIQLAPDNEELAEFIKAWEGCSLTPYKDIAGHYTCGYGHLMAAYEPLNSITQADAERIFAIDLAHAQADVASVVRNPVALPQHHAALVDFCFNFGLPALRTSTLLQLVNVGDFDGAAKQFRRWINARDPRTGQLTPVEGLVKRREAERMIFSDGDYSGRP